MWRANFGDGLQAQHAYPKCMAETERGGMREFVESEAVDTVCWELWKDRGCFKKERERSPLSLTFSATIFYVVGMASLHVLVSITRHNHCCII